MIHATTAILSRDFVDAAGWRGALYKLSGYHLGIAAVVGLGIGIAAAENDPAAAAGRDQTPADCTVDAEDQTESGLEAGCDFGGGDGIRGLLGNKENLFRSPKAGQTELSGSVDRGGCVDEAPDQGQ